MDFLPYFLSVTQVLMTVSDFRVFLGIISWKAALLFNEDGFGFQLSGAVFLRGGVLHWGAFALIGERIFKKYRMEDAVHHSKSQMHDG